MLKRTKRAHQINSFPRNVAGINDLLTWTRPGQEWWKALSIRNDYIYPKFASNR